MKKLISIAACSFAAAAFGPQFSLPAAAQGAGGSVEGGAALGATGINSPTPRNSDHGSSQGFSMGSGKRDADSRPDDKPYGRTDEKAPAKEKRPAQTKEERESSTGSTSPKD